MSVPNNMTTQTRERAELAIWTILKILDNIGQYGMILGNIGQYLTILYTIGQYCLVSLNIEMFLTISQIIYQIRQDQAVSKLFGCDFNFDFDFDDL